MKKERKERNNTAERLDQSKNGKGDAKRDRKAATRKGKGLFEAAGDYLSRRIAGR